MIEVAAANTDRLERVETRLDRVEVRLEGVELQLGGMEPEFGELKAMIRPFIPRTDA